MKKTGVTSTSRSERQAIENPQEKKKTRCVGKGKGKRVATKTKVDKPKTMSDTILSPAASK